MEKIGERILICPQDLEGRSFRKQIELLDQAAETVLAMVKQLRKGTDAETAREMNARLQTIEGDADKLELELLRDLYQGDYKPKQLIFLRDLLRVTGKGDRSLPGRGQHHPAGRAEVFVAGCSLGDADVPHRRCRSDHFRIQQRLSRCGQRDRDRRLNQSAHAAPGDRDGGVV